MEKPGSRRSALRPRLCGRYLWTEDAAALLDRYDVEAHGELQSIRVQEHWMSEGGMTGVVHEGAVWYDADAPCLGSRRKSTMPCGARTWLETLRRG